MPSEVKTRRIHPSSFITLVDIERGDSEGSEMKASLLNRPGVFR